MKFKRFTLDQLKTAISESFSVAETCKKLNIAIAGGNHQTIKKAIKLYGIDISHFIGQGSNKGKIFGPKRDIQDYLTNKQTINSDRLRRRLLKEDILPHQCNKCKNKTWIELPIPLELHHIDGDNTNNLLINLELLCPNCHALTDNYRGKAQKRVKSKQQKIKIGRSHLRKFDISKEELFLLVWEFPTTEVAKQFNVSDKAIAQRCKLLGVEKPPRGYWRKQQCLLET